MRIRNYSRPGKILIILGVLLLSSFTDASDSTDIFCPVPTSGRRYIQVPRNIRSSTDLDAYGATVVASSGPVECSFMGRQFRARETLPRGRYLLANARCTSESTDYADGHRDTVSAVGFDIQGVSGHTLHVSCHYKNGRNSRQMRYSEITDALNGSVFQFVATEEPSAAVRSEHSHGKSSGRIRPDDLRDGKLGDDEDPHSPQDGVKLQGGELNDADQPLQ